MGAITSVHPLDLDGLAAFVDDVARWVDTGDLAATWERVLRHRRVPAPAEADRGVLATTPALVGALRRVAGAPDASVVLSETTRHAVEAGICALAIGPGRAMGNAVSWTVALGQVHAETDRWLTGGRRGRCPAPAVDQLDRGWRPWCAGGGGFGEGLLGALGPEGCAALCDELVGLEPLGEDPVGERVALGRLTVLRELAARAVDEGTGLLHGRDLGVDSAPAGC